MKTIRYLAGLVLCLLTFTACGKDPERGGGNPAPPPTTLPSTVEPASSYPCLIVKKEDFALLKARYDKIPENDLDGRRNETKKNKIVRAWFSQSETDRRAATEEFVAYWKNYAERWTPGALRRAEPDGVSLRGVWRCLHLYDIVVSFGYLTDAQRLEFRNKLVEAVELAIGTDPKNPILPPAGHEGFHHQNIWTDVVLAAGIVGVAFPELPQAGDWVDFALRELKWQIETGCWAGAWHECPRYHAYMLRLCGQFMQVFKNRRGIDLFREMPAFREMARWFVRFSTPLDLVSGKTAGVADGISLVPGLADSTWDVAEMDELNIFAQHYMEEDPDLARLLVWQWERAGRPYPEDPVVGLLVDPDLTGRGPEEGLASDINPEKGHLLMRDGYGTDGEIWFLLKCGKASMSGHENGDCNSFSLYGFGYPLALDSGIGDYDDPNNKAWNKRSCAHNMVVFHEEGETDPYKYDSYEWKDGRILCWNSTPEADYSVTDASVPSGTAKNVRHVLFVKPDYFVIRDEIDAEKEASWMFRTPATDLEWSARSVSCKTRWGPSVDLHVVTPDRDLPRKTGQGRIGAWTEAKPGPDPANMRDYFDFMYQTYLEIPGTPGEDFVTVLHPRREGAGALTVASADGGTTLEIAVAGRRDVVRFTDRGVELDKGGRQITLDYVGPASE